MKQTTITFILLIALLSQSNALDLTTPGDIFGSITATHTGDLNIGTLSLFSLSDTFSLSASSTISGGVTLGSIALNSKPKLSIDEDVTLTCTGFTLEGGALDGSGEIIVNGLIGIKDTSYIAAKLGGQFFVMPQKGDTVTVTSTGALGVTMGTQIEGSLVCVPGSETLFKSYITGEGNITSQGLMILSGENGAIIEVPMVIFSDSYVKVDGDVEFQGGLNLAGMIDIIANANLTVNASVAGSGLINASGMVTFKGKEELKIESYVASYGEGKIVVSGGTNFLEQIGVFGQLIVTEGQASFMKNVTFGKDKAITVAKGAKALFADSLNGAGKLVVQGECGLYREDKEILVAAAVTIEQTGKFGVYYQATLNGAVTVASGELLIGANVTCKATGSLDLSANTLANISGTFDITGDVSGAGTIQYNGEQNSQPKESEISSSKFLASLNLKKYAKVRSKVATNFSGITLEGSSSFTVEGSSSCSGISSSGSSSLTVGPSGSLSVKGAATIATGTTYTIKSTSATASNCLVVSGEATLGGALVIDSSITFDASTKLAVIKYGSRTGTSTFASVTVKGGSKRGLNAEKYEVVYEKDGAYVQKARADDTTSISLIVLPGALLLLITMLF